MRRPSAGVPEPSRRRPEPTSRADTPPSTSASAVPRRGLDPPRGAGALSLQHRPFERALTGARSDERCLFLGLKRGTQYSFQALVAPKGTGSRVLLHWPIEMSIVSLASAADPWGSGAPSHSPRPLHPYAPVAYFGARGSFGWFDRGRRVERSARSSIGHRR